MNNPPAVTSILLLARWRPASVPWGLLRLVRGALVPSRAKGLLWRQILGSGHEGGFGLRPGWDRLGQLAVFADREQARDWLERDPEVQAWQARAAELLWLELRAWQSRGEWAGQPLPVSIEAPPGGPVAALTRASIRLTQARAFWAHSPAAEQALKQACGCRLAVGLGEAPLLRQATFSVWDSVAAMDAYARSGAHRAAAQNAWREGYFSETLFARFAVIDQGGTWSDLRAA
jgi:spheroidene monooxygenase